MNQSSEPSYQAALGVMQQAVLKLLRWSGSSLKIDVKPASENDAIAVAIAKAKHLFLWTETLDIQPLSLLFDKVQLDHGQNQSYYAKPLIIENSDPIVPYPVNKKPTADELDILKQRICQEIEDLKLNESDWGNLSLLTLIVEKYGSFISFVNPDTALIDIARSTAAVASALVEDSEAQNLYLIAGDLSGIQNFIYTISSDGALKSLRARSFYLELVTEEIVQQLLIELKLPKTSVIYAGGGNLYILGSGNGKQVKKAVQEVSDHFNQWLKQSFQGKVFLALDYVELPTENINKKELSEAWKEVPQKLGKLKHRKFETELHDFLKVKASHEPCRVCHRDDLPSLKPLNRHEPDSSPACWMCQTMFELGSNLFKIKAIIRSSKSTLKRKFGRGERLSFPKSYYYLYDEIEVALSKRDAEGVLLINNWELNHYKNPKAIPLLLGNYGQVIHRENDEEKSGFIRANEMTEKAESQGCIPRVGYLRMDVDRLGRIFAEGLRKHQNLPRLASLSRQMTYFFKVYLNSLAKKRDQNFFQPLGSPVKSLSESDRKNLLFIYAGGDDLFISGAWNEVVEFAFDIYQSFRSYTGYNPDITLSGGISLAGAKFPLYQAASESGEAEELAKGNGRDSLGLFGQALKWKEWLGGVNVELSEILGESDQKDEHYGKVRRYLSQEKEVKVDLFGVFPFVQILQNLNTQYSRSFVRNLLKTAQLQDLRIKEIEEKRQKEDYKDYLLDLRYYLHLPQIAYTLARLPQEVRSKPEFKPVLTSLKHPYNALYFRAIATWLELLNRSSTSD